jgi:hypothetical protein
MITFIVRTGLVFFLACIVFCSSVVTGCKKETINNIHDSIIVRHDSIIAKPDVAKLMTKKWTIISNEVETYSAGTVTKKTVSNFSGLNYNVEFKSNGTYSVVDLNGTSTGTWQLIADNLYVVDKTTVNERYYYIVSISETNLIRRGPYTKTNALYSTFLDTAFLVYP